jgi:hypothetical protein
LQKQWVEEGAMALLAFVLLWMCCTMLLAMPLGLFVGACVVLVGPAAEAVRSLARERKRALLERGPLEALAMVAAGGASVLAATAAAALVPWWVALVPGVIASALAPWAAGELLTGPSPAANRALKGALGIAGVVACVGALERGDSAPLWFALSAGGSWVASETLRG